MSIILNHLYAFLPFLLSLHFFPFSVFTIISNSECNYFILTNLLTLEPITLLDSIHTFDQMKDLNPVSSAKDTVLQAMKFP